MTRSAFPPSAEILPSTANTSPLPSFPVAGSTTRAFLIWSRICRCALFLISGHDAHYGHPHRDAERDLRQDDRMRAVGDRRIDLDAAVHRPGVHHDRIALGERELV